MPPEWESKLQNLAQGAWLTIGSFDGIHLGHQRIINKLVAGSHKENKSAIIITFYPHPVKVLNKVEGPYYLTSPEEKDKILSDLGVDSIITLPFNQKFAKQSASSFIKQLHNQIRFSCLLIGHDFKLGANRGGDIHKLNELGSELGFCVQASEPFEINSTPISSSIIRNLIRSGEMRSAAKLLGKSYSISGRIIHGDGRGKHIGLPTANLDVWPEKLLPDVGVYAAFAEINGKQIQSVVNIGNRPTFYQKPAQQTIEAHLLGFDQEIYSQNMRLSLIQRIRTEMKFDNAQTLMVQIKQDIQFAREVLAHEPKETNLSA